MISVEKKRSRGKIIVSHINWVKVDGMSNIFRSPHWSLSIIWSLLLLLNASICTWLISKTIRQYGQYQVSTTTRRLTEEISQFPTVTLCNFHSYTTDNALNLIQEANITLSSDNMTINYLLVEDQINAYMNRKRGSTLTDAEKSLMIDANQMFLTCSFQQGVCSGRVDFTFFYHSKYKNCVRFNELGDRLVRQSGKTNNLMLILYTGVPDSMRFANTRGYYLFIQNSSFYPHNLDTTPYLVTPGVGNDFILQRNFYSTYHTPYSDCAVFDDSTVVDGALADRTLFDEVVNASAPYSYSWTFLLVETLGYALCLFTKNKEKKKKNN